MTELNPSPPSTAAQSVASPHPPHPRIAQTAQRAKDATADGIDRLAGVISTALEQFERSTEQLKAVHADASRQAAASVRESPALTIVLAVVAGILLERLTRD
ncbi:hypothetical protein B7R78_0019160 [Ralstonia solanacearum]|uniref:DUF883 domain-containing protein n=1 Tax=Ralstonia solanacearum K60 TaxID=1091042 RepID=A0AAP8D2H9_RALSL|nr:hypothetical protein [Ralstonia solanacearum]MBT1539133.1 hypothetical protein [Ralstonia solanacearum]OYQ08927.1 hypothetical protein B7R77_18095 [Ralstonia solanacearum K60]OYQ10166.1 hypothetical protein B7R77_25775 [Ralstonia solanacearum K60]QOK84640.1 hypothetical protein HF906_21570 [Ralstonia solanacearum]RIJ85226.1 hypothetical protein RSP822_16690 [Ralstonia solanacearum]